MNILVSHCFLGEPCRYDGASRLDRQIIELHRAGHNLIPVCPELLGGLDVPRPPAELQPDGRVLTQDGQDVTAAFQAGAERVLELNAGSAPYAALQKAVEADDKDTVEKYTKLLYGQALLMAGLPLEDPSEYAQLVCSLMV